MLKLYNLTTEDNVFMMIATIIAIPAIIGGIIGWRKAQLLIDPTEVFEEPIHTYEKVACALLGIVLGAACGVAIAAIATLR